MFAAIPSIAAGKWPERVAIEAYVPSSCIKQADLEVHIMGYLVNTLLGWANRPWGFVGTMKT